MRAWSVGLFGIGIGCSALTGGCAGGAESSGTAPVGPAASGAAGQAAGGSAGRAGAAGHATGGRSGDAGAAGHTASGSSGGAGAAGAAGHAGSAGNSGAGGLGGTGGTAGAAGTAGAGGAGAGFLEPCSADDDCASGVCVEGPEGERVCSRHCAEDCPEDWRCAKLQGSSDPRGVCVPRFSRLCRPCDHDSDCRLSNVPSESGRCVSRDAEGSFCASTCSSADACPLGYSCQTLELGGQTVKQCVPEGGALCECKPSWAGKGYSTSCFSRNGYGTCGGARDCDAGTLSACNAATPGAEVCDGRDNDCNLLTDDGDLCTDAFACTTNTCRGASGCETALAPGSCQIGYACYAEGDANPSNPCERCVPARSTTAWTAQANSCAIDGACWLVGEADPANACRVCNPSKSTTSWTIAGGSCFIGGACQASGAIEGSNVCSRCDASRSQTAWSPDVGRSCSDADSCTGSDLCQADRSCRGTLMADDYESNETPGAARGLGPMNECDDQARSAAGKLSGTGDADWFSMNGNDELNLCTVDPGMTTRSGGATVRACVYIHCDNGTTTHGNDVSCYDGAYEATHPGLGGYAGCCKVGVDPSFRVGLNCDGLEEDATLYASVDALSSSVAQCTDYSFDVHF